MHRRQGLGAQVAKHVGGVRRGHDGWFIRRVTTNTVVKKAEAMAGNRRPSRGFGEMRCCCFCFIPAVSGAIGATFETDSGRRTEVDETKEAFVSFLLCLRICRSDT